MSGLHAGAQATDAHDSTLSVRFHAGGLLGKGSGVLLLSRCVADYGRACAAGPESVEATGHRGWPRYVGGKIHSFEEFSRSRLEGGSRATVAQRWHSAAEEMRGPVIEPRLGGHRFAETERQTKVLVPFDYGARTPLLSSIGRGTSAGPQRRAGIAGGRW